MTFEKGHIPWNKGKHTGQVPWNKGLTKETDLRVAKGAIATSKGKRGKGLGKNNPFYGKRHSKKSKEKIREAKLKQYKERPEIIEKIRNSINELVKSDPNYGDKVSKAIFKNSTAEERRQRAKKAGLAAIRKFREEGRFKEWQLKGAKSAHSPNKLELGFLDFLRKYFPNEWLYNGDGRANVIIGGMMPDFVHCSMKKLLELYGDYWHQNDKPQDRVDYFQKYGYDCLVIWEHEVYKTPEKEIINIISNFING